MIELTYHPGTLWLTGAGLLLAGIVVASYLSGKGRCSRSVRLLLTAVRWTAIGLVVVFLLDPQWVEAIKRQQKTRVAVLLDNSRSMATKDLGTASRLEAAKHWVENELAPNTRAPFSIEYYTVSDGLTPVPQLSGAQVTGQATALADGLEAVLSLPSDDPLSAVVVCSDGIENVRKDIRDVARTFRRKGIPVHTLTTGLTNDAHDIIVENVQVKRATPNQAPTKVTVNLRAPGFDNRAVAVQVLKDNEVVAARDVTLNGEAQKVELDFTPRQKGFQIYEIRVPVQPGEWLTSNNQRLFGLEVIDPTIRVIYMEGTPQQPASTIPEWQYLKSALESDPNIKVKVLYREFGANGKRLDTIDRDSETGERIYPVEHRTRGFPKTLASLLEYDVVIHSDIRKESFTSEQLQNIARLVEEFGGGFVMIGGNSAFGKGGYHRTILDRIIPVAMHQEQDSQARPFRIAVPTPVWNHPLVALGGTRAETEAIWTKKFPLLYGCNVVERAKPGATILAFDPASAGPHGARLILAVQGVGRGRSMAFTSDTTRTWGKDFETMWGEKINPGLPLSEENCDSRYYRQFWANAVRWLAAARIGRTNHAVTLELAQSYARPGELVEAAITVRDKNLRETAGAEVRLVAVMDGSTNQLGTALFDSASRTYRGQIRVQHPGRAIVSAIATSAGAGVGDDRQLLVCEALDAETADLRARPELMAELARISGGKTLATSDADASLERTVFYNAPAPTMEYKRRPAWDRAWWLCAVLGLLTVEWTIRRIKGLA